MHSREWSPSARSLDGAGPGPGTVGAPVRGLCFSKMGLLALGGAPSPLSLFSREGEVPASGFRHPPPPHVSPHTVILLSAHGDRCGLGAPQEAGLGPRPGLSDFWGQPQEEEDGLFSQSPLFSALTPPPHSPTSRNPSSRDLGGWAPPLPAPPGRDPLPPAPRARELQSQALCVPGTRRVCAEWQLV